MPRKSRIDAPGELHHIIARGIERRQIFEDNAGRDNFLARLGSILKETEILRRTMPGHLFPIIFAFLNLEQISGDFEIEHFETGSPFKRFLG